MKIGLQKYQKFLHYFYPKQLEFSAVKMIFIDSKYTA